jgi:hypothetical protein
MRAAVVGACEMQPPVGGVDLRRGDQFFSGRVAPFQRAPFQRSPLPRTSAPSSSSAPGRGQAPLVRAR